MEDWRLQEIKDTMRESYGQMKRGEIPLARFGMGGGQFENAASVLAAFEKRGPGKLSDDADLVTPPRDIASSHATLHPETETSFRSVQLKNKMSE